MSSRIKWNDVQVSPNEVVHVAAPSGKTCGDCGAVLCLPSHSYPPYAHVVVLDKDPAASWQTRRNISCNGSGR